MDIALELGATHVVNSATSDPVEAILAIWPDGVDYAIDSTAPADVIANAVASLRARGTCVIVGAAKPGTLLTADMNDVMQKGKIIRGAVEGDSVPDIFIPQLVDLYMQGRFPLDKLVRFYPFEEINEAAEDSERGHTLKPIIRIAGMPAQ